MLRNQKFLRLRCPLLIAQQKADPGWMTGARFLMTSRHLLRRHLLQLPLLLQSSRSTRVSLPRLPMMSRRWLPVEAMVN